MIVFEGVGELITEALKELDYFLDKNLIRLGKFLVVTYYPQQVIFHPNFLFDNFAFLLIGLFREGLSRRT
jgi:hypothetical protein